VVVHELDAVRSIGLPDKADSPPVVDVNAVLGLLVSLQRLQVDARRDAQGGELGGGVDLKQLAPRDALDVADAGYPTAAKQALGIGAREPANHARS
jgi:hypothetical protein